MFNKLSNKTIWILLGVDLILAIGVIVLYFYKLFNETIFVILLFVILITFSTLSSTLMQRSLTKKMENKRKGKPYYYQNEEIILDKPLKEFKANYGKIELYLEDRVLYSLIKVTDANVFFSDSQQEIKYNVGEKKYDRAVQFYLFYTNESNLFRKISVFNYQAKNFYIASFIVDEKIKSLYQTDNVKPNEDFQKNYDRFIELLKVTNEQEEQTE